MSVTVPVPALVRFPKPSIRPAKLLLALVVLPQVKVSPLLMTMEEEAEVLAID